MNPIMPQKRIANHAFSVFIPIPVGATTVEFPLQRTIAGRIVYGISCMDVVDTNGNPRKTSLGQDLISSASFESAAITLLRRSQEVLSQYPLPQLRDRTKYSEHGYLELNLPNIDIERSTINLGVPTTNPNEHIVITFFVGEYAA